MAGAPAGVNALRLTFTPETGLRTLPDRKWHPLAVRQIQFFRFTTLRYRTTERFAATLKALRGIRDSGIVAEAGAKAHCFAPWPEPARGE